MTDAVYRVLARKYRPTTFAELIGQEALVRTLSNAIRMERLAQAFMLTGVRGVGKTTTARLIARALNCVGPDGKGGPTIAPCGVCDRCLAIAEDRHPDVIELDAASHTGVDHMRELIDGVRYRPVQARYKVYVLDEVHMLSDKAFNALLKTLEEPPPHVKFVFCTTEIRKVPVTVLSRCQRFDLRRVDAETMTAHLAAVADKEGVQVAPEALALIVRAAEGSVRDALSLLDQAIAYGAGPGSPSSAAADPAQVRAMLGLADRGRTFDIFERLMAGDAPSVLKALREQYDAGADPAAVLQDLLEITHWVTRVKLAPEAADDIAVAENERLRGRALAQTLSLPALARAWQMLLKGMTEARGAPAPLAAAEMVLIRIAYAADLPAPAELVRELSGARVQAQAAAPAPSTPAPPAPAPRASSLNSGGGSPRGRTESAANAARQEAPEPASAPAPAAAPAQAPAPGGFAAVVALFGEKREMLLKAELVNHVHLVRFEPGRIELRLVPGAPQTLAGQVAHHLTNWTGRRWVVVVSNDEGEPTLAAQAAAKAADRKADAARHPLVQAAMTAFPGAEIVAVRDAPEPEISPMPGDDGGEPGAEMVEDGQ
jgi:DNA polymerase III subunit gamma/tau